MMCTYVIFSSMLNKYLKYWYNCDYFFFHSFLKGEWFPSKKLADKSAALCTVRKLDEAGELDCRLKPYSRDEDSEDDDADEDRQVEKSKAKSGTGKCTGYYQNVVCIEPLEWDLYKYSLPHKPQMLYNGRRDRYFLLFILFFFFNLNWRLCACMCVHACVCMHVRISTSVSTSHVVTCGIPVHIFLDYFKGKYCQYLTSMKKIAIFYLSIL